MKYSYLIDSGEELPLVNMSEGMLNLFPPPFPKKQWSKNLCSWRSQSMKFIYSYWELRFGGRQYILAGVMTAYLNTNRVLSTGSGQFVSIDLELNIEAVVMLLWTSLPLISPPMRLSWHGKDYSVFTACRACRECSFNMFSVISYSSMCWSVLSIANPCLFTTELIHVMTIDDNPPVVRKLNVVNLSRAFPAIGLK
jgi:hypothetical protein